MNKVYLIGRLTKDPEVSTTKGGISVCRFTLAVNRNFTSENGEREADFFNVTAWRGQADNCGKYLFKGSKAAVIGSLQNRTYEDKDGVKRTVTDVIASEVEFLDNKKSDEEEAPKKPEQKGKKQAEMEPIDDDDMPF